MTNIRVAAIIKEGDKVLTTQMEKSGDRYYVLPGGKVEIDENIEEALKRELKEETGIEIKDYSLAYLRELKLDGQEKGLEFYYRISDYSGKPETGHDPENKEGDLRKVEKLPVEKLEDETFFPKQLIEKLQENEISDEQKLEHLGIHDIRN